MLKQPCIRVFLGDLGSPKNFNDACPPTPTPRYQRFPAGCCHALTGGSAALRLLCRSGKLKVAPLVRRIQCRSSVHIDRRFVSYLRLFFCSPSCDAHSLDAFLSRLLVKVFIAGCYIQRGENRV